MKRLDLYLIRSFAKVFALSACAFLGLFLVVTIFEQLRSFAKYEPAFSDAAIYILARTPWMLTQVIPISSLIGAVVTLSLMSRNNEITAMRASGISLVRLARPLALCGAVLAALTFWLQEMVVPPASSYALEVRNVNIKGMDPRYLVHTGDMWMRYNQRWVHVGNMLPAAGHMGQIEAFETSDGDVKRQLWSNAAVWRNGAWQLSELKIIEYEASGAITQTAVDSLTLNLAPPPEEMYVKKSKADQSSMAEIGKKIRNYKAQGLSTNRLEVDWWAKTSQPFTCLLMPLLAIPFGLRTSRRGGLWSGVATALGIGFAYMLALTMGLALGQAEHLAPWLSAWAGNIIFGVGCVILYRRAERGS